MIAQYPPRPNKKHWLLGSRIWASWDGEKHPPLLYDFIGTFQSKYFFMPRFAIYPSDPIGFSMAQIIELGQVGAFRPFLIDTDKLGMGQFVVEE